MRSSLPGPWGPFAQAVVGLRSLRNPYDTMIDLKNRYGPVVDVGYGPARNVLMLGRDANEHILFANHENFRWREAFRGLIPIDGDTALVVTDGEEHDRRRGLVQPAFSKRRIDAHVPLMVREADLLIDELLASPNNRADLYASFRSAVRRIAIRTQFGDSLGDQADFIGEQLERAIAYADSLPYLQMQRNVPGTPFWRAMRARKLADNVIYAEITKRRQSESSSPDLLDVLIASSEAGQPLTDIEIRDQVVSLVAAGYDTTSALLAWLSLEVLQRPDLVDRLRAELRTSLGAADPSAENLASCSLLDAVVHESLRLHPPGPFGARYAVDEFEFGGHQIPGDRMIIYSSYVTHRDPEYWERPLEFWPDRWLRGFEPDRYAFVPFGGGYRKCIGFALATLEAKVLFARFLMRVEATPLRNEAEATGLISMVPKGGVPASVAQR